MNDYQFVDVLSVFFFSSFFLREPLLPSMPCGYLRIESCMAAAAKAAVTNRSTDEIDIFHTASRIAQNCIHPLKVNEHREHARAPAHSLAREICTLHVAISE